MTTKGFVELVDAGGTTISVPPDRAELMVKGGGWKMKNPPPKPKPAPKPTGE